MILQDVRLIQEGIPELLPMQRSGDPRDHVSHVIRDLCVRLGHFAIEEEAVNGERDYTLMELGSAFEEAVIYGLASRYALTSPDRYARPGEFETDGLIGTPDLMDVLDWLIHEIKLTKLSSNHGPDSKKFWKYWVQLMAYCYMVQTTTGVLHVCHVNGDYRENRSPIYRVYEAHFTIAELKANWAMLIKHRALLKKG